MKIGIFGGAFNPIHYGHLRSAEEVFEIFSLDKILFVPDGKPPFRKSELTEARHRYKMVNSALKDNPYFKTSGIEIKTQGKSYTVNTISRLKKKYKNAEFFLILGIDAFLDLPEWKQPEKIIGLTNLIVISRPGYSFSELSSSPYLIIDVPVKVLKELDKGSKTKFSFSLREGKECFLCRVTGLNISASGIRDIIKTGKDVKYLLPDSVKSYIISHKLYIRNE